MQASGELCRSNEDVSNGHGFLMGHHRLVARGGILLSGPTPDCGDMWCGGRTCDTNWCDKQSTVVQPGNRESGLCMCLQQNPIGTIL
jgi:hypothetical protein